MRDRDDRRRERAEQLGVELVRECDIERVGDTFAVLDGRDGVAQRRYLVVELLGRDLQLRRPGRSRRDEHRVNVIAGDRHPVISFAWPEDFLQVGQRDGVA